MSAGGCAVELIGVREYPRHLGFKDPFWIVRIVAETLFFPGSLRGQMLCLVDFLLVWDFYFFVFFLFPGLLVLPLPPVCSFLLNQPYFTQRTKHHFPPSCAQVLSADCNVCFH